MGLFLSGGRCERHVVVFGGARPFGGAGGCGGSGSPRPGRMLALGR
ncbi:hypothetical protein KPATCC21470_7408 [Kitasatospora purpeofusca]